MMNGTLEFPDEFFCRIIGSSLTKFSLYVFKKNRTETVNFESASKMFIILYNQNKINLPTAARVFSVLFRLTEHWRIKSHIFNGSVGTYR